MAREFLCVYLDMLPTLRNLGNAELGRLILAALEYSTDGTQPVGLVGKEAILWPMFMSQIDEDKEYQKKRSETNRQNAAKRYDRIRSNATASDGIRPHATACDRTNNNINNNNNNNKSISNNKSNNKKFIAPTREEVRLYAQERNSTVDPDRFFDFYDAGGWADSKGTPVRNWKQKFITWEKKDAETPKKPEKITNNPFMQMLIDRGEL